MNIKEKERKRAVFLYCAGPRVQDIFDALEDAGGQCRDRREETYGVF